jgi:hypothetical protein
MGVMARWPGRAGLRGLGAAHADVALAWRRCHGPWVRSDVSLLVCAVSGGVRGRSLDPRRCRARGGGHREPHPGLDSGETGSGRRRGSPPNRASHSRSERCSHARGKRRTDARSGVCSPGFGRGSGGSSAVGHSRFTNPRAPGRRTFPFRGPPSRRRLHGGRCASVRVLPVERSRSGRVHPLSHDNPRTRGLFIARLFRRGALCRPAGWLVSCLLSGSAVVCAVLPLQRSQRRGLSFGGWRWVRRGPRWGFSGGRWPPLVAGPR